MKTLDAQIEAMAKAHPDFKVVERDGQGAIWEGQLQPIKRIYDVRVLYIAPLVIEQFTLRGVQPRVQVLNPVLERHHDYELGPIPHVYFSDKYPALPYLCLFDPEGREWTPEDLIADTTIPWAAGWLFFYEGWLLTKRWYGRGRHDPPGELEDNGNRLSATG